MLTLVKLLCQDTETEIRAGICRELGAIARALGRKKASQTLLVELEELMRDEESLVIVEALRTFVNVVDLLDRNSFADVVSNLIRLIIVFSTEIVSAHNPVSSNVHSMFRLFQSVVEARGCDSSGKTRDRNGWL